MPASITVTLDKSTYAAGETMRATVTYVVPDDSIIQHCSVVRFMGADFESPVTELTVGALNASEEWELESNEDGEAVYTAAAESDGTFEVELRVLGETVTASADYTVNVLDGLTMLIGSSNVDNATELSAYEGRYGPLLIRRSYNQPADDLPPTWAATVAAMDVNKRASVWSFKPNIPSFATGGYDAKFRAFLGTVPEDGYEKIVIIWHEPEGELKAGLFTPLQFKTAAARCDVLVKETHRPDLTAAICFAGTQCFDGQTLKSHGWDADDLAPEGMAVAFDAYNKYPQSGFVWKEASERLGLQAAWANASGRAWGVSETGCYEHPDGPQVKVQWTRDAIEWARSEGASFFCYWDNAFPSDADKDARRLHSSPEHIAAWRDLTQGQ